MKLQAIILSLLACLAGPCLRAAEETTTFRIIGFSHAEREDDFRQAVQTIPGLVLVSLDLEKAEVTLRYDPATILPNVKADETVPPEKVLQELDNRIGQASTGTFILSPGAASPETLSKVEIPVGLLDCKGCRYGVYIAVAKIEGVDRARVSTEGMLTAWLDPAKTNREALIEALKNARIELP